MGTIFRLTNRQEIFVFQLAINEARQTYLNIGCLFYLRIFCGLPNLNLVVRTPTTRVRSVNAAPV